MTINRQLIVLFYCRTEEVEGINEALEASGGSDFDTVFDSHITIRNGTSTAVINITIFNDTIPELNETLHVKLTSVQGKMNQI